MYTFEFTGRAPSAAQLRAHIKKAAAAGHGVIELIWGENQITLEKRAGNGFFGPWFGHGWIRRAGGDDLARELSQSLKR
jgi:hypothetical protein